MKGKLYIVATPIGNLKDITLRAIEVLKSVDFIACEDTRTSKKLLDAYDVVTKLVSYHQHSDQGKIDFILGELTAGKNIAVITDAGTPGISDPGNQLVAEVVEKTRGEIEIISIPGPAAVIAALAVSGFPTDKFIFLGFMPHKKGRQTFLRSIAEEKLTAVFYDSTHRVEKTLEQLTEALGTRKIVVCRELTKKFETVYRGTASEVLKKLQQDKVKGEFVLVVSGKDF